MSSASSDHNPSGARDGLGNPNAGIPRQKRLACLVCRKRKLKCDGHRPSCSTCARLGHSCAYDEVRKRSGPKRGYVKALEERLIEVALKNKDAAAAAAAVSATLGPDLLKFDMADADLSIAGNGRDLDLDSWQLNAQSPRTRNSPLESFNFGPSMPPAVSSTTGSAEVDGNGSLNWELVQLGLEEPLPTAAIVDELNKLYFDKIHPSIPMIHKARFYAAMNLAPKSRPPVCLRYAMWSMACTTSDKYADMKDVFYQRARKYIEIDTAKGFGEHMTSVAHCQTHIILAEFEFKMMHFPRAWLSTGKAIRLCQMIGMHRLDGDGLAVKQCIPEPRDWTEKEERRRTFWMAFCEDRYASVGTGWPMTIDERDITSGLPSSETAYQMSRDEPTMSLEDAMKPSGIGRLSPFSGIILTAYLFGRNLNHLHRPDTDNRDHDINGDFWVRHRNIDNIVLNTLLGLPDDLKLPHGLHDSNVIFTNMCLHTSTICLHQAAIFKAEQNDLSASIAPESKVRCINAANEITRIMRMVSHTDLSSMNPFVSFCLYVSARVFVQYLKNNPDENQIADSLRFLLSAMSALKRRNPLTESFLAQVDFDLETLGQRVPRLRFAFPRSTDSPTSGPPPGLSQRTGAVCEDATDGILSYQKEFKKADANPNLSVGDSEDSPSNQSPTGAPAKSVATASRATSVSQQEPWFQGKTQLPTRDRNLAQPPAYPMQAGVFRHLAAMNPGLETQSRGVSIVDEIEDVSTSPGDGVSSSLTPDSSINSDFRQNLSAPKSTDQAHRGPDSSFSAFAANRASLPGLVNGPQLTVGVESTSRTDYFAANHGSHGGVPVYANISTGPSPAAPTLPVNDPNNMGNLIGSATAPGEMMMPQSWPVPGQTDMDRSSEGVLRTIIQLGPMETMDLGWGADP